MESLVCDVTSHNCNFVADLWWNVSLKPRNQYKWIPFQITVDVRSIQQFQCFEIIYFNINVDIIHLIALVSNQRQINPE